MYPSRPGCAVSARHQHSGGDSIKAAEAEECDGLLMISRGDGPTACLVRLRRTCRSYLTFCLCLPLPFFASSFCPLFCFP